MERQSHKGRRGDGSEMMESPTNSSSSSYKSEDENSITINSDEKVVENGATATSKMEEDRQNPTASFATAVDIGPESRAKLKRKEEKAKGSIWSRLIKAANVVEENLAEWFGFNDSKYQWAVDEAMNRQLAGESQVKPAPSEAPTELRTEPTSQQAMHRDTSKVEDV
ncbi:unnamed protein product [Calypogeia fissa]